LSWCLRRNDTKSFMGVFSTTRPYKHLLPLFLLIRNHTPYNTNVNNNYSAIVELCIFTIFCEQEHLFLSSNIPCHDVLEASVNYYIMHETKICSRHLWRINSEDTMKTKDHHSEDTKHCNSTIITNQIDVRKLYKTVYGSIQYGTPV
jgi:hypothetical protein